MSTCVQEDQHRCYEAQQQQAYTIVARYTWPLWFWTGCAAMAELRAARTVALGKRQSHSQAVRLLHEQECAYKQQSKADSMHCHWMNYEQDKDTTQQDPCHQPLPCPRTCLASSFWAKRQGLQDLPFPSAIAGCLAVWLKAVRPSQEPSLLLATLRAISVYFLFSGCVSSFYAPREHISLLQHLVYQSWCCTLYLLPNQLLLQCMDM